MPIVFKEKKVLLDNQEISTYQDVKETQVHLSPDGLKLLILDGAKTLQIFYLHDIDKLKETMKTIPLESALVAICWF